MNSSLPPSKYVVPDTLAKRLAFVWVCMAGLLGLSITMGLFEVTRKQAIANATAEIDVRLNALAWRVRAELSDVTLSAHSTPIEGISAKETRLPRMPKGAEVFLGVSEDGPLLVRKASGSAAQSAKQWEQTTLPSFASLAEARSRNEDVLLVTTAGLTVWPAAKPKELSPTDDVGVRSLIESGLGQAAKVDASDGPFGILPSATPRGLFLRQIPDTNLVVVRRVSLRGMLAPALGPVLLILAWGTLVTLFVAALSWKATQATFAPVWGLLFSGERALANAHAQPLELPAWLRTKEVARLYGLVQAAVLEKQRAALERELIDTREASIATFIAALPATTDLEHCMEALAACLATLEAAKPGAPPAEVQMHIEDVSTQVPEGRDASAALDICRLHGPQGTHHLRAYRTDGRAFDKTTHRMAQSLGVLVRARARAFETAS